MTPLLTVAEAAELLRVSKPSVYRAIRNGGLPAVRPAGDVRIRPDDLEAWLETRRVGAPA